ncbi:MAG: hypothetical protein ACFCGT_25715 [Sandaracinaceae bacterium]
MSVRRRAAALALVAALGCALLATTAIATSTERFVLDDAESLSAGEMVGTAVHSDGRVTIGASLARIPLPEGVGLVYALARGADGAVYLGTDDDGAILRLRGDEVTPFASTGQLVVSSLAIGPDGTVYAGTLPEGRIFSVTPDGQASEIARPDGTEHVWALAWHPGRRRLLAGTGPEGQLVAIDPGTGAAEVWWDAPAGHVMSLALDGDTVYAGTSDEAVVARVSGPDRVAIVHDFPGNEITALAVQGGVLAVAANQFPDPPPLTARAAKQRANGGGTAPRPRPGQGRLFRIGLDGRPELLVEQDGGHFAAVALLPDGTVVAGAGAEGRVVRAHPDRTSTTWIDVDERQVLALDLDPEDPLLATGDGAAVYRILQGRPTEARWDSKVLDARFRARWGQLDWRGEGDLVLQTRSGETEEPDETWSDWSTPIRSPGPIRSPAARFLQVRARFERDPDAVLWAVTAYFLPQNQRATVGSVRIHGGSKAAEKRARAERQGHIPDPGAKVKLVWEVDNPDGDRLRYRVRFRLEDQSVWRDALEPRTVLTERELEWDTAPLPDGFYRVEVEASDELDNTPALTLRDARVSEPLRIDNHAPVVRALRFAGGRLTGRAVDGLGPIARLELAVDGGDWRTVFPEDDLFDTAEERFAVDLTALPAGPHVVAVRATDASGNAGSAELEVTAPAR